MKKIIYTLAAFAAASVAFISCQQTEIDQPKEEINDEPVEEVVDAVKTYTFAIVEGQDAATKTIIGDDGVNRFAKWENGDELAYLINDGGSTNSSVVVAGEDVTFNVTGTLTACDYLFAWYPNFESTAASSTEAKFNVPYAQTQDLITGYDLDAFPMVAKPIEVTSAMLEGYDPALDNSKPLADVRFANLGSLINFKVFSTKAAYQSEKVISVTFDAGTDIIAGTYAVDLMGLDFDDESTLALRSSQSDAPLADGSSIITTTLSAEKVLTTHVDKASALDVYMTVIPGSYTGKVVVLTDQASYTFRITSAKTFARGAINTLGLDLNKVGTTAIRQTPVSYDLTTATYVSASDDAVTWSNSVANMVATKESGTKVTNYLGGSSSNTHTRLYNNNKITFSQNNASRILKVVFTTTETSYNYLSSETSTWTNALAVKSTTKTIVTPEDITSSFYATLSGTSRITGVDIYYYGASDPALSAPNISRTSPTAGNEVITLTPANLTDVSYSVQGVTPAYVDGENISFNDASHTMTVPFLANKTLAAKEGGEITIRASGTNIWGESAYAEKTITVSQAASVFSASSTADINISWDDTSAKTITFTSSFALTDANITNSNTTNFDASFAAGVNENEYTLSISAKANNESAANYAAEISVTRDGLTPIVIDVTQAYSAGTTSLSNPAGVTFRPAAIEFTATWTNDSDADGYTWVISTADDPNDIVTDGVGANVPTGGYGSFTSASPAGSGASLTGSTWTLSKSITLTGGTTYYFYVLADGSGSFSDSDYSTVNAKALYVTGLTNAQIFAAAAAADSYASYAITGDNSLVYNAYAIKKAQNKATSTQHYLQIKKYASSTAYYIQVPTIGTKIVKITMTVSSTSTTMTGGGNTATYYFSSSNSTSATGSGVVSGTGDSSVTLNTESLNLNTGYITAGGATRVWELKVFYENW
jgi:hypothetical protein